MKSFKFFHGYVEDEWGIWDGVMPLARRMAGRTIAQELVNVQPMIGPTGRLFYLDYNYDTERINNRTIFAPR